MRKEPFRLTALVVSAPIGLATLPGAKAPRRIHGHRRINGADATEKAGVHGGGPCVACRAVDVERSKTRHCDT